MRHLTITASLLLLVQAFHLASLQYTTDSPGKTIDKSWLRVQARVPASSQNAMVTEGKTEKEAFTMEENNDYSGTASGLMPEEENASASETNEDLNVATTTLFPVFQNGTVELAELPTTATTTATTTTTTTTAQPTTSSQVNVTEAEDVLNTTTTQQNPTSFADYSNHTDLQSTTLAPESNTTEKATTALDRSKGLTNNTGATNTTTLTTTAAPEISETTTMSSSTTAFPPEILETSPATTTVAPISSEKSNKTDKSAGSARGSERGFAPDPQISKRRAAWGAVLGTAVAVAFVGLVACIILKKKQQKAFAHRKLVEEYPSDPVLRLDNSEPLDLKYGGSAYYNPGLQGDNIQMTNFPGRR